MTAIFYGAAIQGAINREKRASVHRLAIETIQRIGFTPLSEHTAGRDKTETAVLLEKAIGKVPEGVSRSSHIRRTMLGFIDGHLTGVIFEASIPSIGTGIELHHACTRVERGLPAVPILTLYQKGYWPSGLSTMVRGIEKDELPFFQLVEYEHMVDFVHNIKRFLGNLDIKMDK
jgi:hypothetical protein